MTISEQMTEKIRQMYNDGMTQEAISAKLCIARSSLSRILSRQRSCSQMTIETLEKAFPGAVLDLSGMAAASVPEMEDPQLFAMVVDCWQKITTADRAAIVGEILTMAKTSEKTRSKIG